MSAATLTADSATGPVPAPRGPRAATRVLALAEARLLLRSPVVWIAAVLTLALPTALSWTRMPHWPVVTADLASASVVLAGGVMIAGQLAASRQRRHRMSETLDVLPTSPRQRALALLVVTPVAALVASVVVGVHLLSLRVPVPPVGVLDWWELLAAVAIPAVGATVGLAVGRWLPGAAAGPLALLGIAALVMSLPTNVPDNNLRWLAPNIASDPGIGGIPQPSGWHLVYLCALAVAAGAVALLRHHRRVVPLLAIGLATMVGAGSLVAQARSYPDVQTAESMARYAGPLTCQRHGDVDYCAFRGYEGWIDVWRGTVEPVAAAVPASARTGLPAVHQRADHYVAPENPPRAVPALSIWGRQQRWAAASRADFAIAYAGASVGLPADGLPVRTADGGSRSMCWAGGQARTVVALWLAAQSLPDGGRWLRSHRPRDFPAGYGRPEIEAATALLAQPRERVIAALDAQWRRVTAPTAGGEALAPIGVATASLSGPRTDVAACP